MPLLMLFGVPQILAPSQDWLLFIWTQQLATVIWLPLCTKLLDGRVSQLPGGLPFWGASFLRARAFFIYTASPMGAALPYLAL